MDEILKTMTGTLLANLLTVAFIYGMYWAFKTKTDDHAAYTVYAAVAVPALFLVGGMFIYR